MLTSLTIIPGMHRLATASGTHYLVTVHADGSGLATGTPTVGRPESFRFARISFGYMGGDLRGTFHGFCAVDRDPVEFDRPGCRVLTTSAVESFDLV